MGLILVERSELQRFAEEISALAAGAPAEAVGQDILPLSGLSHAAAKTLESFAKQGNLTNREAEILRYICVGLSNRQIADLLCVSVTTVRTHAARILGKLEFPGRRHLVIHFLLNAGVIDNGASISR